MAGQPGRGAVNFWSCCAVTDSPLAVNISHPASDLPMLLIVLTTRSCTFAFCRVRYFCSRRYLPGIVLCTVYAFLTLFFYSITALGPLTTAGLPLHCSASPLRPVNRSRLFLSNFVSDPLAILCPSISCFASRAYEP
jgi:hypothetical protein